MYCAASLGDPPHASIIILTFWVINEGIANRAWARAFRFGFGLLALSIVCISGVNNLLVADPEIPAASGAALCRREFAIFPCLRPVVFVNLTGTLFVLSF